MRLHSLTVTAFGPFGTTQEVDFDSLASSGIFLLHGPTGAGKTSVLDAVCFALYGAVPGARQSSGASLRSDHAPAGTATEVTLELTVAGRRLEVSRRPEQPRPKKRGKGFVKERAQSTLREYDAATGEWQALSKSHQEIGEEITQLLGMSREQFCQVVLLPQGDFARFLRADAEARGKLLGRLFDTRRFAAVEDRLAELRRAAEQQVRTGDERLLAVAHRIEQAAGPAAAEWPRPEQQPGDPGLAAAVLQWAAVARSGARERLDIAEHGLAAAESRRDTARRDLESEQERDRLQRRHADALARSEALEARRAEQNTLRTRLERARKAALVEPALRVRDAAEREHQDAARERERARAGLPPELTDAGADQLTAAERALREESGGLDAARRAEARAAGITRELADLDRQAQADDDTLAEAAGWLAEWDGVRRGHQERITAAQDAATRAEHLAGRLEPARERLRAARERDELAARADRTAQRLRTLHERTNEAKAAWLDLKERRLQGIAAELAAALVPGQACAVCGSEEHPAPARAGAGHVDRAAEDAAYAEHARAEQSRAQTERELAVLDESRAAAAARARGADPAAVTTRSSAAAGDAATVLTADGAAPRPQSAALGAQPRSGAVPGPRSGEAPTVAGLLREVEDLEREHAGTRALAAGIHAAREALAGAEREHEERTRARQEAERRSAARTSRRETLDQELAGLESEISRARGDARSVAERAALLERQVGLLAAAADAVRAVDSTALRLKEADDRLADAAFRAGFRTPAEAAAALLPDAEQRDIQHRVDAWQAEAAAVADRLADDDTRAAAGLPPASPETARAAHDAAERALRDAASALDAARARCAELDRLSGQAVQEILRLGPLREEYDRFAGLAALTAGTSADNERKMRLESYVLAARLEQVAAAATVRLARMSSGRYTLVHSDARTGGKRAGLGLHVVDAWTGRERDTATLSGGETFFASLALALGLADVVTDEAGGVRLDTLFIDEGFGSLDDQTLDEVLDVLDSLRERDRSVGIVSHVGDLRRRIPAQLEVVKDRGGSAVRLRAGAALSD
ncbi:AAA family ATPase [Streptomyces peucetius]|uniref:Nuclease SbcCD subunit C n=1 Tax=Streptomyces peucetius TaxID=1950 RepID=A0ABY6I3M2_STRPE|nr:SMC family ATPase [Streptomyces peucetius]UYQ60885.1 SMC family ATPase [Streptomyces peucetius]